MEVSLGSEDVVLVVGTACCGAWVVGVVRLLGDANDLTCFFSR